MAGWDDIPNSKKDSWDEIPDEKKTSVIPGWVKPAEIALETAGTLGGAVLGAPAGPLGGVAGAGLGYAAARQAAQRGKELLGYAEPQGVIRAGGQAAQDIPTGAAMEMGGQILGPVISKVAGGGKDIYEVVRRGIEKGVRPSVSGKSTFGQFGKYLERSEDAVKAIISEKPNLEFIGESGEIIKGELPKNLRQFSQAIDQTKKKVFETYNALAEQTPKEVLTHITGPRDIAKRTTVESVAPISEYGFKKSYGGKVIKAYQEPFPRQASELYRGRVNLDEPLPLEVPSSISEIKTQLPFSHFEKAGGPVNRINLKDIAKEVDTVANSKSLVDFDPGTVAFAKQRANALRERGGYNPMEAQDSIAHLNNSLEAFYKNPSYENATKASIDAMIANRLRKGLDRVIENATGPGYQELKNTYGALSAIEKDVTHRAVVDARKNIKGLIDFSDIFSGSEVVRGILMMNPKTVGVGFSAKAIASLYRYINNPNRIVSKMFSEVENIMGGEGGRRVGLKAGETIGRTISYTGGFSNQLEQ